MTVIPDFPVSLRTRVVRWLARVLLWLRRPRFSARGTLPPVAVTPEGIVHADLRRVPVRSSKADAKREALAFARRHWHDPNLTWGQARKRLQKLERALKTDRLDEVEA